MDNTKPRIFYEGGQWLVWTSEELTAIRNNGKVFGYLCMTSPLFPHQSTYLTLPAKFSEYEVLWCYEKNICTLLQPIFKKVVTKNENIEDKLAQANSQTMVLDNPDDYDTVEVPPPQPDPIKYQIFKKFKEDGFWVIKDSNYGSDFCIYVKEPWACHSSALVWCESPIFNARKLIEHVRIAESSHKKAIAAIPDPQSSSIDYIEVYRPSENRVEHSLRNNNTNLV